MHPSIFINELWNGVEDNSVFVAMSFHESYKSRYEDVIKPAIERIKINDENMRASRVDERKSGDSILTEIVRGITSSRIVIADISSMGKAADGYNMQRNGNVMYELGIAHAVKSPEKVIIIKDDREQVLFDLSSIPHFVVDFFDDKIARNTITNFIIDRIHEGDNIFDYKIKEFARGISPNEFQTLKELNLCPDGKIMDLRIDVNGTKLVPNPRQEGVSKLLVAGVAQAHHIEEEDFPFYSLTERGKKLSRILGLPRLNDDSAQQADTSELLTKPGNR